MYQEQIVKTTKKRLYFNIKISKLNYGAHKKYGARKNMVHITKK